MGQNFQQRTNGSNGRYTACHSPCRAEQRDRDAAVGVGTSTLKETAAECVKHAIGLRYRLVDAAQGYDNEAEVWYGIKESGIGRSEVFIISKVSPDAVRSGKVRESLDRTIEAFGDGESWKSMSMWGRSVPSG